MSQHSDVYRQLKQMILGVQTDVQQTQLKTERAETAGGVQAFTYAAAPRAAQGGMSTGAAFIDVVWISNGLKPGESTGAGTGVLAVYDAILNDYRRIGDYAQVTT